MDPSYLQLVATVVSAVVVGAVAAIRAGRVDRQLRPNGGEQGTIRAMLSDLLHQTTMLHDRLIAHDLRQRENGARIENIERKLTDHIEGSEPSH